MDHVDQNPAFSTPATSTGEQPEAAADGGAMHDHALHDHALHDHALHDRGLLAIAIFKMAKSAFFFCVGMGALHFLHKDLGDEVLKLARELHRDPEGKLVSLALKNVHLIDEHRLRQLGVGTFSYSALALTEGIGLLLEKTWAEFLTLGLTISFLPWEIYELIREATWIKAGLFAINLAVLGYLVWLLERKGTFHKVWPDRWKWVGRG
jgi:uncharacterized membrane protein (DUF2068 family)